MLPVLRRSVYGCMCGGVHLRGLAPGQQGFEETSQRWPAVDDTASESTGPGTEP